MPVWFQKVIIWFQAAMSKSFAAIKANSYIAVQVTEVFKSVLNSPAVDFITALTRNTADDLLVAKLRPIVNAVAKEILLAHGIYQAADKNSDALTAVLDHVRQYVPEEHRAVWYVEFAGRINEYLADGKLDTAEAWSLAQMAFKKIL